MKIKNILITGSSGLIGRALCDFLLQQNHKVYGVDIQKSVIEHTNYKHLYSISNFDDIVFDEIYHLSGTPCPTLYLQTPYDIMKQAAQSTFKVIERAIIDNAKVFIASSSEIYADTNYSMIEEIAGDIDLLNERSCYKEAKRFMEVVALSAIQQHKLNIKIGRIFNTYGPSSSNDTRMINAFITAIKNNTPLTIYGNGHQKRSYCYVNDTVKAIEILMNSDCNMPVNIGNPKEIYSVNEVIELLESIIGKTVIKTYKEQKNMIGPMFRHPNINKMIKLQWAPETDLRTGIQKIIQKNNAIL